MAFSIKHKYLGESRFQSALSKLYHHADWANQGASYNVGKIVKECENQWKDVRAEHDKILRKHAEVDEQGNLVKDEESGLPFKLIEEKKADYEKAVMELMDIEFKVERHPIKVEDMGKIKLSAAELEALEPMIDPSSLEALQDVPQPGTGSEVS